MNVNLTVFPPGSTAVIRGIIDGKLWLAQSVTVVQDSPSETVLLLRPGAECAYPSGYWRWKQGDTSQGNRWDDVRSRAWTLRRFQWHTKRLLMLMRPGQIYALYLIWDDASGRFQGYYINFQTPFVRTALGFNILDLELDIEIDPQFQISIKDAELYREGVQQGCITAEQDTAIRSVTPSIYELIQQRRYPLDGSWVDWRPDPNWEPARLPEGWEDT